MVDGIVPSSKLAKKKIGNIISIILQEHTIIRVIINKYIELAQRKEQRRKKDNVRKQNRIIKTDKKKKKKQKKETNSIEWNNLNLLFNI